MSCGRRLGGEASGPPVVLEAEVIMHRQGIVDRSACWAKRDAEARRLSAAKLDELGLGDLHHLGDTPAAQCFQIVGD